MKIDNLDELIGQRVVVTADHGTLGYMVTSKHLDVRRVAAVGLCTGHVPGHGGDVVWVQHDDHPNEVGAYCHLTELEFVSDAALIFAYNKSVEMRKLNGELTACKVAPFKP